MTETEIANLAIDLIGGKSLVALSTDQSAQAVSCRKWFDVARDEVLGAQNWNFASKRDRLTTAYASLSGVALAASGDGEIAVDHTSHGLSTGHRVYMKDVEGVTAANGRWLVTVIDPNTFVLDDSVFSGSHTSGTGEWTRIPAFSWDFWHTVPADCLKLRRVNSEPSDEPEARATEPYRIEGGKILSDLETVYINYTYRNETTTEWPAEFITAFSYLLASYLSTGLTGGKSAELRKTYEGLMLPAARTRDAREGMGDAPALFNTGSRLLTSRF